MYNNYETSSLDNRNDGLRRHYVKTFLWMSIGVAISFTTAFFLGISGLAMKWVLQVPMFSVLMLVAQIGVVIAFANRVRKGSLLTTQILFIAYSLITGITLSVVSIVFALDTIIVAFVAAVVFFASLVIIGTTTKMDLTKIGTISIAGLFALIIVQVVGSLFGMNMDTRLYSILGLVLFVGITAWDAQKMKQMYYSFENDPEMLSKVGVYSAFELYLDFINIFLYLVRLLGRNQD